MMVHRERRTKRPALLRCLKNLERGDTVTVWKLDRLGRSCADLITMLDSVGDRGVKFRFAGHGEFKHHNRNIRSDQRRLWSTHHLFEDCCEGVTGSRQSSSP